MISLSPCVIVLLSNVAKGNEFCLPVNVALFSRNLQSVLLHPVIKHKVLKKLPQNVCVNKQILCLIRLTVKNFQYIDTAAHTLYDMHAWLIQVLLCVHATKTVLEGFCVQLEKQ